MKVDHIKSSKRVETRIRVLAMMKGLNTASVLQRYRGWRELGWGMVESLRRVGLVRASWEPIARTCD